jgi:hypothetical protein
MGNHVLKLYSELVYSGIKKLILQTEDYGKFILVV